MQASEEIVSAIVSGIGAQGVVSRLDMPEQWDVLDDPSSLEKRRSIEQAMGVRIFKGQDRDQSFFIFAASAASLFAVPRESLTQDVTRCANAKTERGGDTGLVRASWALIYYILISYCFDRDIAPNCLRVDRLEVGSFMEVVSDKMRGFSELGEDCARADLANVARVFLSRPETDQPNLQDDRKRSQTRAGLVNHMLRYLAKNGLLDKKSLDEGVVSPTPRFCEAYRHCIASREMLDRDLAAFLEEGDI